MEQKRKFPRIAYPFKIGVLSYGRYVITLGEEIGEKGMSFHGGEERGLCLNLNDLVLVNLTRIYGKFFCFLGIIRNHRKNDTSMIFGVEFIDISLEQSHLIRTYVLGKNQ